MSRSRDTVTVYLFKKREKSKKSPQIKPNKSVKNGQ